MELEYAVSFGREKKRADIVIFDRDKTTAPYIMVELKTAQEGFPVSIKTGRNRKVQTKPPKQLDPSTQPVYTQD
jgi:hypothetical protein